MTTATLTSPTLAYLCDFIKRRSGIVLDASKEYLLQGRLAPVLDAHELKSLDDLVRVLRERPSPFLYEEIIESLTINETSFFRDTRPFDVLEKRILPELDKKRANITIWSAACSAGQEPYSLAMLIREHAPQLAGGRAKIVATDISARMLARAKAGTYSDLEVRRGMPQHLLSRYFERVGTDWKVDPSLQKMIEFRPVNLVEAWPQYAPFDLVLMRNVLIYFDQATKQNIFTRLSSRMNPEGYLILGAPETLIDGNAPFRRDKECDGIVYRPVAGGRFGA